MKKDIGFLVGLLAYMVGFGICVAEWKLIVPALVVGIIGSMLTLEGIKN